jgi:ribonuclease-3
MGTEAMEPDESRPPPRPARDPLVAALEERLGVGMADAAVAVAAITHKSYVNEHRSEGLQDNERLEFLGDAVIDLAVSHRLMERFPEAREGDLSKIRAALVDEAALARIARELDLGSLLRLGRGEELTGGRQKSSLLADALEAVVAALYLEGGLSPVLALVDRFLSEAFARAAAGTLDRDYKTQLQELAQSRLRASPRYRVVAEHGPDHSKVFDVELELRGEVLGRGAGRSKKDAEQAAAKTALDAIPVRFPEVRAAEAAAAGAGAAVEALGAGDAPPERAAVGVAVVEVDARVEPGPDVDGDSEPRREVVEVAQAAAPPPTSGEGEPAGAQRKRQRPAAPPAKLRRKRASTDAKPVRRRTERKAAPARKRALAPASRARKPAKK